MRFELTNGTLGRYCLTTWRHPHRNLPIFLEGTSLKINVQIIPKCKHTKRFFYRKILLIIVFNHKKRRHKDLSAIFMLFFFALYLFMGQCRNSRKLGILS